MRDDPARLYSARRCPRERLPLPPVSLKFPGPTYAVAVPGLTCAECGPRESDLPGRMLAFRAVEADEIASLDQVETYCAVVLCHACAEREGMVDPH